MKIKLNSSLLLLLFSSFNLQIIPIIELYYIIILILMYYVSLKNRIQISITYYIYFNFYLNNYILL